MPRKITTNEPEVITNEELHTITPTVPLEHPTCAELEAQLAAANAKNTELEKLCKAYAEKAQAAENALHRATMEYNARNEYMLDCVKHAYISIQFAVAAATKKKGEDK